MVVTPELRDYLSQYVTNLPVLYKKIEKIVDKNLFGVNSFAKQAEELLAQGLIDDRTFYFLSSQKRPIDDEIMKQLDD